MTKLATACIYCDSPVTRNISPGVNECPRCESLLSTEPNNYRYTANYHAYQFSFLRPKLLYLAIKALRAGLRRHLTVCDIGCGAGHTLWFAKHFFNCTTIGFDLPKNAQWARGCDHFYYHCHELTRDWGGKCDLVWCWHTVEHSDHPASFLSLCLDMLNPGGEVYLEFPEAASIRSQPDGDLKTTCMMPEHRGIPSRTWAIAELIRLNAAIVTVSPPVNPSWLYAHPFQKTNSILIRARKRQPKTAC